MAQLIGGYITLEKLEQIVQTVKKKGDKGFSFTAAVNDEQSDYGHNVSLFASQTEEQRKAKDKKWYFGNGRTFWSNKDEYCPPKKDDFKAPPTNDDYDLPF